MARRSRRRTSAYAVERTCDPNTAGEYQGILFEITGCADFAAVDPADTTAYDTAKAALGATTPDDKTLVLNFGAPAPYYATVASLWVFYPTRSDLVEPALPRIGGRIRPSKSATVRSR